MQEELIKEEEEKEKGEQARTKDSSSSQEDAALTEMIDPTSGEARGQVIAKTLEKQVQLCELSRALAVLASASSVSREREEFMRLVNKEIELYNRLVEKEDTKGEAEAKKAYRAAREEVNQASEKAEGDKVSSALIDRVDAVLQKLEKEIDNVDAKIGDRWRILDRYINILQIYFPVTYLWSSMPSQLGQLFHSQLYFTFQLPLSHIFVKSFHMCLDLEFKVPVRHRLHDL
ncbi:hypothetical protein Sjap_001908 [Stephania japonica]|uniref:Uncharacterized protein n=1 Tax=Stephania japonica TaxID=461633 RepID=A0AAP0KMF1_9MAGN